MSNLLKLSVSKVKSFSDCQKKYNFAYNLKLPQKEFAFFAFGKFIHQVLEDFHLAYINGSTDPYNIVMSRAYNNAMKEYKAKMSEEDKKEAYDIVDKYLKMVSNDRGIVDRVSSVEKNFNFNITEDIVLNGMIDRIQLDTDGVIHVADYKTTKNKKYLKDDFLQLLTYAYVIWSENKSLKKIRGSYILLRHNFEHLTKDFHIQEILEIKDKYENYAKQIKEEQLWEPTPTRLCAYCSYVDICDEGKSALGRDKIVKRGEINW